MWVKVKRWFVIKVMDKKIKDMSNSDLAQLQQELMKEYELVRKDLINMY